MKFIQIQREQRCYECSELFKESKTNKITINKTSFNLIKKIFKGLSFE